MSVTKYTLYNPGPSPDQSPAASLEPPEAPKSNIKREPPDPPAPRRALVGQWQSRVEYARRCMAPAFKRMRGSMDFAYGYQWPSQHRRTSEEERYICNIALRHVQSRTASLYASNPTVVARKRKRMLATVWDGDALTLQAAQQQMQQATQIAQVQGIDPMQVPGMTSAAAILADFKNVQVYDKMLDRICETLEILWKYEVDAQTHSFKAGMKMTIRRAIVTGVGYVKLGFQRAYRMKPEIERQISDMTEKLATIERLAADLADKETDPQGAQAEELRLAVGQLKREPQLVVREGLAFSYPDSFSLIVDPRCRQLRGFVGADWVAQEYYLTVDEVQEVYGVDVGYGFRAYSRSEVEQGAEATSNPHIPGLLNEPAPALACIWEIYHRKDGLVYVLCDGYKDFLQEPGEPEVYNDDFFPWYPIVLNETYNDREVFPRSDIELLKDMQLELNRARQGLREQRHANRPKMAVAAGVLDEDDKDKLQRHPANAVLELNALSPGQKIEDVLQPIKMPAIDPALYDTNGSFEDLLRVLGQDQASMGEASDVTATESAVADASRHTDLSSVMDDQDDMLSALAQAAGKIMLTNISPETVQKIVGPGAVWPQLTREQVSEQIYLTVKAGSTGRPNRQQEIQAAQIIFPMLQRIPGISPEWMARELLTRMDDRLDLTEAFAAGVPSMDALNRMPPNSVNVGPPQDPVNPVTASGQAQPGQAPPPTMAIAGGGAGAPGAPITAGANAPQAQGDAGGNNTPVQNPINGMLGPRTPPVPGMNGMMPGRGGGPRLSPDQGQPTP